MNSSSQKIILKLSNEHSRKKHSKVLGASVILCWKDELELMVMHCPLEHLADV